MGSSQRGETMSENAGEAKWRTPDGIMRKIRLRKTQTRRQSLSALSLNSPGTSSEFARKAGFRHGNVKPSNPFAKKRPLSETDEVLKKRVLSCSEFELPSIPHSTKLSSPEDNNKADQPFIYLEEDSIQGVFTPPSSSKTSKPKGVDILPSDWTIKRKARFLSASTFSWCSRIKGVEDANAIVQATRCQHNVIQKRSCFSEPSDELQRTWRIELGKCLTYWQQPSIPWLNLFPRYGLSTKLHSGTTPAVPLSEDVAKSIHDCWMVSFRSVLQLTRECLCPYFYVCAQQYTALFRAPTMCGEDQIFCALTPTTPGLRQLLKNEGIEFCQPQNTSNPEKADVDSAKIVTPDNPNTNSEESEEPHENDSMVDESTWDFINQNIKLAGPKETVKNPQAETSVRETIFVRGNTNIQLLLNYLVNSKSSITKSGSQANVPPTILSPIAFEGASLQKLSVKSGIARSYSESTKVPGNSAKQYSLDISGPLLPHCLLGLQELLKNTQRLTGFRAAFSTSLYTVPLNAQDVHESEETCMIRKEKNFGMPAAVIESLQRNEKLACLNQVTMNGGLFTWNE